MRPWECPRCKKVNAPWINQCFCGPVEVPTTVVEPIKPALRAALLPARKRDIPPTKPLALGQGLPPLTLLARPTPLSRPRTVKAFDFDTDEDQETEITVMPASFELRMDDD